MSIESVTTRVSDIQSQILALQAFASPAAAVRASTGSASAAPASGSFASHLSEALGTQSPKTFRLNGDGIPTELAAYGDKRVPPPSALRRSVPPVAGSGNPPPSRSRG